MLSIPPPWFLADGKSGKDYTKNSPANPADSIPQGKKGSVNKPLNTSKSEASK